MLSGFCAGSLGFGRSLSVIGHHQPGGPYDVLSKHFVLNKPGHLSGLSRNIECTTELFCIVWRASPSLSGSNRTRRGIEFLRCEQTSAEGLCMSCLTEEVGFWGIWVHGTLLMSVRDPGSRGVFSRILIAAAAELPFKPQCQETSIRRSRDSILTSPDSLQNFNLCSACECE